MNVETPDRMYSSNAATYFEECKREGFYAEDWIGRAEDDWLDFKETLSKDGKLGKSDLDNLAKALSAFANSDGGLIVWGVACKQSKDADEATTINGVPNPVDFVRQCEMKSPMLCDPPVSNVRHIRVLSKEGKECVVSYIPSTQTGLHRANRENLHSFFFRAGSRSLIMPTWLIADRFGLRPHAHLRARARLMDTGGGSHGRDLTLFFHIENAGPGVAYRPAMRIQAEPPPNGWRWSSGNFKPLYSRVDDPYARVYEDASAVIYPHQPVDVADLGFTVGHKLTDRLDFPKISICVSVFQDGPVVHHQFELNALHVTSALDLKTSVDLTEKS